MTACALVTGAAKRIGATIVNTLHGAGFNITLHYHRSQEAAAALVNAMNQQRPDSAVAYSADLCDDYARQQLVNAHINQWGRLDVLVNNASRFYPTPLNKTGLNEWHDLISSNLEAPFFLSQLSSEALKKTRGSIINIADLYAATPLKTHSIYSISKAGLVMMTKSLALDLSPWVRVNAVCPGNILWPAQNNMDAMEQQAAIERIPLKKQGSPSDIAEAVLMLINQPYMTGQTLFVDGGKHLGS